MKTFAAQLKEKCLYQDIRLKKDFKNIGELNRYFQNLWGIDYHICTLNGISTIVYTGKEGWHTWIRLRMDPINDKQYRYFKNCQTWADDHTSSNFSFQVDLS